MHPIPSHPSLPHPSPSLPSHPTPGCLLTYWIWARRHRHNLFPLLYPLHNPHPDAAGATERGWDRLWGRTTSPSPPSARTHPSPARCAPSARGLCSTWPHPCGRCGPRGCWGRGRSLRGESSRGKALPWVMGSAGRGVGPARGHLPLPVFHLHSGVPPNPPAPAPCCPEAGPAPANSPRPHSPVSSLAQRVVPWVWWDGMG